MTTPPDTPPSPTRHRRRRGWMAVVVSVALTVAAVGFVTVGLKAHRTGIAGLLEVVLPIAAAATPLLELRRAGIATALRGVATVLLILWMMFIGGIIPFLPAALAMAVATGLAATTDDTRPARHGIVAAAAAVSTATVAYYMGTGFLGETGAGGLWLWAPAGLATYGFIQLHCSRNRPLSRALIWLAALLTTPLAVSLWHLMPATVLLWAAAAALLDLPDSRGATTQEPRRPPGRRHSGNRQGDTGHGCPDDRGFAICE